MSDDLFAEAPAFIGNKPPTMAMLGNGAPKVKRTYAKGDPDKELTKDISGRLVLISTAGTLEHGVTGNYGPQDRYSGDVIVLDGSPITEIVDKDGEVTLTLDDPLVPPFELAQLYLSQVVLLGQIMQVKKEGRAWVLGRLGQLPPRNNNKSWALFSFTPEEAKTARDYLNNRPDAFGD